MFILGIAFIILIEEFLKTNSVIIGVTRLLCRYTPNPHTQLKQLFLFGAELEEAAEFLINKRGR